MRILQDFKLINGDGVGEILLELHFPEGALVEKAVNDRMANHFDNKGAQGVRVIDSDTGKVIYKQTWWDERRRREATRRRRRSCKGCWP
jgi:hypothetical protein